ncbi:MAG TPA: TIGR04076 family protein [Candidatus Bathyarchaeota archaeon]|nr:TIGR04076 family protein [Candidatus Bathyarchaeota archaeon]
MVLSKISVYQVEVIVEKVRGKCPLYRPGDSFTVEGYFIKPGRTPVCIHAFSAMLTLLSAFSHGSSAVDLGIGSNEDVGYLQCPDPGPPYTHGGTVTFRLVRKPKH